MLDNSSIKGDRGYLVRHSINVLLAQGQNLLIFTLSCLGVGVSFSAQGRENIGFSPVFWSVRMTLQVVFY